MSTENNGVQWLESDARSEGQRLDNFLLGRLKGVPRSRIYRLIRKGEIRVNRKRCKPDQRLLPGDVVRVAPIRQRAPAEQAELSESLAQRLRESILYRDQSLLVLNKPPGIAVHGGSGVHLGLIEALRQLLPEQPFVELVHRLDRDTSGCLLVALTPASLKFLQDALRQRAVHKVYHALVQGEWDAEIEEVRAPLQRDELAGGERFVRVNPEGKPALTRFRLLERLRGASLIEAMPVTGRMHQIRVHCQYAGYPILGDSKYLLREQNRFPRIRQLCLHAAAIRFEFPDPDSGVMCELQFDAPWPERLQQTMAGLSRAGSGK